jgi:hypothetical protein
MKSPMDASRKLDGARCTTGMSIPEKNLMVCNIAIIVVSDQDIIKNDLENTEWSI